MRLASNKVIFTGDQDSGSVAFRKNQMQVTKPLNCLKGIMSQNVTVSENARMVVTGKIEEAEATSVELTTTSPGATLSLAVPGSITPYTLKFPANQGAQDEYLQLGNNGALQWTPVSGSQNLSAQEGAWNFGTIVQLWSNTGDPFTDATSTKIPFTRAWRGSTGAGGPIFIDWRTQKVVRLIKDARVHWDQQSASSDWDFRVSLFFENPHGANKGVFLFGNDTENPSGELATNVGIRPEDNRGSLVWIWSNGDRFYIRLYEKGVAKPDLRLGFPIWNSGSKTMRLQRRNNQLRFEIFPSNFKTGFNVTPEDSHVVGIWTLTQTYTGTRWGVGVTDYDSAITYAEVRTI